MDDNAGQPRLLISSSRKPVSYINLAKRLLQEHGEVQLSALGVAISSMVTLAEILKNKQLAVETRVVTSLEEISSESRTRHKPKMSVTLRKSPQFDDVVRAEGARSGFGQGALGLRGEDGVGNSSHGGSSSIHHLRGGNAASNGTRSGGGRGLRYQADPLQQQRHHQQRQQQAGMPPLHGAESMPGSGSANFMGMSDAYGVRPSTMGVPDMGSVGMGQPGSTVPQLVQYLPGGGGSGGGMQPALGLDALGGGLQQLPGGWPAPQASTAHMSGGRVGSSSPGAPPLAQQQQYAMLQQQLQMAQQRACEAQQQQQQLAQQLRSLQLAQQQAMAPTEGAPQSQQPLQHEQHRQLPYEQQLQLLQQYQQTPSHPQSP